MIPLLVKKSSFAFQMIYYLFYVTFRIFVHTVAFVFWFLQVKKFSLEGHLKYMFLDLGLSIICLLSSVVINEAWLPQIFHFFGGACLSVVSMKILVNLS